MTLMERIRGVLFGMFMILGAAILLYSPGDGYLVIATIYGFVLLFSGIRLLIYYVTLARLMVGGKTILYLGVIRQTGTCGFYKVIVSEK